MDTLNNDPDYDSDDVVDAAESTVLRRLRFYRRSGAGATTGDKGASGEGGGAASAPAASAGAGGGEATSDADVDMGAKGAGAGAGAGGGADGSDGGEPFSDYVQTEMLCHIHLPPAALASSTCEAILNRSVLVRSQLQLSYHRLFVACASLTHFPGYFFAYHHHRHPNRAPLEDEELSA